MFVAKNLVQDASNMLQSSEVNGKAECYITAIVHRVACMHDCCVSFKSSASAKFDLFHGGITAVVIGPTLA